MKYLKFISICLMASFAMSVSAAVTAQATLSVKGDEGNKASEITLTQDNAAAANFADLDNAIYIPGSSQAAPGFYALNGSDKYMEVVLPDLNGLKIKFEANAYEEAYTMSFSGVTGSIILANADTSFVIDATKDYKFTCAKSATVEFTVSMPYTRPVTAGQAGTICYPKAITAVTGGTLYELTGADDSKVYGDVVTFPTTAGMPYVFKADAAATELVMINTGADAAVQEAKGLVGTLVDTTTPEGAWGIMGNYVVKVAAGNALLANRAYIDMEDLLATGAPSRGRAIFMISNTATGMELIEAPAMKEGKMILNGRMVIVKDGKMFNAQGAAL